MENPNTNMVASKFSWRAIAQNSRLPIVGFFIMLIGPGLIRYASHILDWVGHTTALSIDIIVWTAFVLPGIGAVLCIVTLFRWKRTGKLGRVLAIVTVAMCNPFFYSKYFLLCYISRILLVLPHLL